MVSMGLEKLFFELASESRLGILTELQKHDAKMPEIARKLDLTNTETFRQLQRLNEALLIEKRLDGSYGISQNGKLLLEFSHSFEFVSRFGKCLLTRDLWRMPYQFINRLGELSDASLSTDTNEMVNNAEALISGAEKFLWLMGQRPLTSLGEKTNLISEKGISVKLIFDEASRQFYEKMPQKTNVEKRVTPTIPAIMVISEKYAGINLLSMDNRADNMILYGMDPKILKWAHDLFFYYWEQGKRVYPT